MKIQDIFNLPKNRGGAKLFNRIMNKYGIPKEDSKELKNNVDNSSSGGGGKVEYYNIINEDNFNDITDTVIFQMGCKCIVDGIKRVSSAMYVTLGIAKIISISYYPTNLVLNDIEILLSDNFYNAFYKFIKMIKAELTDEQIREYFNSTFVPITEEEFYKLD